MIFNCHLYKKKLNITIFYFIFLSKKVILVATIGIKIKTSQSVVDDLSYYYTLSENAI